MVADRCKGSGQLVLDQFYFVGMSSIFGGLWVPCWSRCDLVDQLGKIRNPEGTRCKVQGVLWIIFLHATPFGRSVRKDPESGRYKVHCGLFSCM